MLGSYDIKSATKTVLWLFCLIWFVWPVKYFFYYRFFSYIPAQFVVVVVAIVEVMLCHGLILNRKNVFYVKTVV